MCDRVFVVAFSGYVEFGLFFMNVGIALRDGVDLCLME
jgi:hypothetical protein